MEEEEKIEEEEEEEEQEQEQEPEPGATKREYRALLPYPTIGRPPVWNEHESQSGARATPAGSGLV